MTIREWLCHVWSEAFPLSGEGNPTRYVTAAEGNPIFAANTTALGTRILALPRAEADLIQSYAKDQLAAEHSRADSILSRAQALLVAEAFLSALLSLGGTIIGHLDTFGGWRGYSLGVVTGYLVIQTLLLTAGALRAIRGRDFPAISSSELLAVLPTGADGIVREMSLRMLLNYRTSTNLNTWRFIQLGNAQTALRNTTVALAVLVILTFAFSVLFPPATASPELIVHLPRSEFAAAREPDPLSGNANASVVPLVVPKTDCHD
jgi:hypothetical protein